MELTIAAATGVLPRFTAGCGAIRSAGACKAGIAVSVRRAVTTTLVVGETEVWLSTRLSGLRTTVSWRQAIVGVQTAGLFWTAMIAALAAPILIKALQHCVSSTITVISLGLLLTQVG